MGAAVTSKTKPQHHHTSWGFANRTRFQCGLPSPFDFLPLCDSNFLKQALSLPRGKPKVASEQSEARQACQDSGCVIIYGNKRALTLCQRDLVANWFLESHGTISSTQVSLVRMLEI